MSILKVTNLCKKIGKKEILKNVSFTIEEGEALLVPMVLVKPLLLNVF